MERVFNSFGAGRVFQEQGDAVTSVPLIFSSTSNILAYSGATFLMILYN